VKKLSGQQNIQQRIHHHARIKEENNALRLQNEDLNVKLRRSDILFARVNDELARYRIADGKTPFLNIDEEQCLRSKLQEAEESNVQMAQKFVSLCTSILQVAGISQHDKEMDQSLALEGLKQIEDRLQSMEQEISDLKLKTRIAGEKRRLSELRAVHSSPMKPSNFFSPQR
jgi:kinesin family protein 15